MPSTTKLLVDVLSIGSVSAIWIGLILWKIPLFREFADQMSIFNTYKTIIILSAVAVVYQVGWFINWAAFQMTRSLLERNRDNLFSRVGGYKKHRLKIYQDAIKGHPNELENEVTEMRMCRANCLNAIVIAGCSLLYGFYLFPVLIISLIAVGLLAWQTYKVHIHHYQKLYDIYRELNPNTAGNPNKTLEKGPV